MKKIMKNPIFIFILSAIIFSSMGVVIAATILAKDVSYTPNNANWKVDNVGDAIDELYSNYKNKISTLETTNENLNVQVKTLTTTNSKLNSQVDTLTTQLSNATNAGLSGVISVKNTTTAYTIDLGFKPSKVFILQPKTTDGIFLVYTYDSSINDKFIACWTNGMDDKADNSECSTQLSGNFSTSNTGFTFKAHNVNCLGTTYWYAIK